MSKPNYVSPNPPTSQGEAERIKLYLYRTTSETLGISMDVAKERVDNLYKSGLLEGGHPEDPKTQELITRFLQLPTETFKTSPKDIAYMLKSYLQL